MLYMRALRALTSDRRDPALATFGFTRLSS